MIARHRREYPLTLMCRVLTVSRSGFHAWRTRAPSARATADDGLRVRIAATHQRARQEYGARLHREELQAAGLRISRRRVGRVMHETGCRAVRARRWQVTTQTDPTLAVAPNLLARQFTVPTPNRVRPVPHGAGERAGDRQYESPRGLLGQRGGGELLRHAEAGTDPSTDVADAQQSDARLAGLHRWLVQSGTTALAPRLCESDRVRSAVHVSCATRCPFYRSHSTNREPGLSETSSSVRRGSTRRLCPMTW